MKGNVSTFNLTLALFATIGSFLYGFNSAIMGTVFGLPSWYAYFKLDTKGPGAAYANNIIGSVNGIWSGGGIIGCCILPFVANKFGRKPAIQATAVLCLVAVILQLSAVHVAMLLIGRLLGGVSAAMINCVIPMYQSEIAPAKSRGRLVGLHGFCIVIGYATAGWAGLGCYFETNPQVQWRLCLGLQVIAPLALLVGSTKIPESPRYLVKQGREAEALELLCKLHHSSNDPQDLLPLEECLQIKKQLALDEQMPQGILAVMNIPSYRKRFIIGIGVQCLAQSTGVLVVNNYQVILLNGLGVTGYMPLLLYAIYASWAAILNLVSALVVDRAGRVRMLSIGLGGCVLMMTIYTSLVASYSGTTNKTGQALAVLFLYLYVTFYAGCLDAVTYVYCSEIFPTQLRASGMAASVAGLFATTLLYTQPAPQAFATIGWKYYLIFILVPLCGLPFLWLFCPETKGLSLEEIGACFGETVAVDITHMSSEEKAKLDSQFLTQPDASPVHSTTKNCSVSYHEEAKEIGDV